MADGVLENDPFATDSCAVAGCDNLGGCFVELGILHVWLCYDHRGVDGMEQAMEELSKQLSVDPEAR